MVFFSPNPVSCSKCCVARELGYYGALYNVFQQIKYAYLIYLWSPQLGVKVDRAKRRLRIGKEDKVPATETG